MGNGEVAQELTRARLWPRVSGRKILKRKIAAFLLALTALVSLCTAYAQQGKVYRIGIVRQGGSDYSAVEGLKEVLKELGLSPDAALPGAANHQQRIRNHGSDFVLVVAADGSL